MRGSGRAIFPAFAGALSPPAFAADFFFEGKLSVYQQPPPGFSIGPRTFIPFRNWVLATGHCPCVTPCYPMNPVVEDFLCASATRASRSNVLRNSVLGAGNSVLPRYAELFIFLTHGQLWLDISPRRSSNVRESPLPSCSIAAKSLPALRFGAFPGPMS